MKSQDQPWEMVIDNDAVQRKSKTYSGVIAKNKTVCYTIHPVYKMQGINNKVLEMPIGLMGFGIRNKPVLPVAAISLADKGVVYLNATNAEERFFTANVCAALLLQQSL